MALTVNGTSSTMPSFINWGTNANYGLYSSNTTSTSYADVNITSTAYGNSDSVTWNIPDASAGGNDTIYGTCHWTIANEQSSYTTYATEYIDGVAGTEQSRTGGTSSPYYQWLSVQRPFDDSEGSGVKWYTTSSTWTGSSYTSVGDEYTGSNHTFKLQARASPTWSGLVFFVGFWFRKDMLVDVWDKTQFIQSANSETTRKWKMYLNKIGGMGFPTSSYLTMDGTSKYYGSTSANNDDHYHTVGTIVPEITTNANGSTYLTFNGYESSLPRVSVSNAVRVFTEGVKFTVSVS